MNKTAFRNGVSIPGLFAVVLVLASSPAQAQEQERVSLTLADAEERALDKNPAIRSAGLGTEAATYGVAMSRAVYQPLFSASIVQRSQTTAGSSELVDSVNSGALSAGTAITQALPWGGGSVSLSLDGSRGTTAGTLGGNAMFASGATVSLRQPLVGGLTFDANRAEILQAEIESDIADVSLRQERATTLAGVRRAYWELVYAIDALETARQSEALAQRQLDENRRRSELGTVAAVDIVEAEAEVAARYQAVVQADGAVRISQVALKELLVADSGDPLWSASIVPADRPEVVSRSIDVPSAIVRAVANRSDADIVRKQQEASRTSIRLLSEQTKPAVDLVAEYTTSSALRSVGSTSTPSWSVGVDVTLPFGSTAAKASLARASVQQRQVDVQLQALEVAIAAQVTRFAEQVRTADEQVRAAAAARALAERRLQSEEARRAAGLSTNFLVLQAQRDLATAQTNELRAALDYRTALVNFDLVQEAPV